MRFVLTAVDRGSVVVDYQVDTAADTTVGELAAALGRRSRPGAPGVPRLFVDGAPLDPRLTVVASPLRQGAVVGLDRPVAAVGSEPRGLVEVRVVGGADAGAVHRLDFGEHLIGAAENCRVRISDPGGPPVAARLRITPDGRGAVVPVAGPPMRLDRTEVVGEREWPADGQLAVGDCLLELARPERPDAALQVSEDGVGLDYNRPPRLLPPPQTRFALPSPPPRPERRPLPYLTALAPLLISGTLFAFTRNPLTLVIAVLSPIVLVGNTLMNRRYGEKSYKEKVAEYEEKKQRISAEAREALTLERVDRRTTFPDPAVVLLTVVGPRRRLWERRRSDPDFLELRAGTADLPSDVVLTDPTQDEHRREVRWDALDVPITVPLREHGVLGVAGGPRARAVAAWMIAQTAALHSPEDLQLYLLSAGGPEAGWEWMRWLPHVAPRDGQDTHATLATDTPTLGRRVAELSALIAARAGASGSAGTGGTAGRAVLVVLDGARRLRSMPGVTQILRDGPAVGVFALCLDVQERLLPEECQAVVVEQPDGLLRVARTRAATVTGVRPDLVGRSWYRTVARALAPVRDTGGASEDSALPDAARLLDVLGMEPPEPDAVAARWTVGGRTTEAVLGISLDGPFSLDLRRDGPHALVAGTTGSGKSELLQTLVAALAVANRPDAMTFVLVDYKGGSAFKDCVALPHTVGMVTDLDTHLVSRALTSLSAELRRREHILADAGAKDIDDYVELLRREPARPPMPRLLIVIDEFASLVRDLPDFVTGLVNIAQRGRSLGIHLVLATQRPGGVVSPEIRANTNLRIALRVTDSSESQDVINAPDAAAISKSTPGRAYVRLAQSSLVPFQAGRVGGFRPGARPTAGRPEAFLAPLTWADVGAPGQRRPKGAVQEDSQETDLAALVGVIRAAAQRLRVPPQHSPWLAALPAALTPAELPAPRLGGYHLPAVAYGLVDLPDQQAQVPLEVDLATLGHLHVIGSPRSGRSQALRSLAGALASALSPADVHLYGVDCGNGALLALTGFPHTGAVVQRTEPERLGRLLGRLTAEASRRQQLLAATGSAGLVEYRASRPEGDRPPHLVLLVDRWEVFDKTFADHDGGALMAAVLTLLREGAGVGIHLVLAGDRALLSTKVSSSTEDKLVLRLNDRADYSLTGINHRNLPDEIPSGRAIRPGDDAEVQIAMLGPDPAGQAQAAVLAERAAAATARFADLPAAARPFRVDPLPDELDLARARELARPPAFASAPLWAMVGVGGDELAAVGPDLAVVPSFIIAGPPRSGRSTVLLTMVFSLLAAGTPVVLAAPRRSPLRELAGLPGVLDVVTDENLTSRRLAELTGDLDGPHVVALDDAESLLKCDAGSDLGEIARTGAESGRGLLVAGSIDGLGGGFGGWHVDARRNRQGLLLQPQGLGDGELIGIKVSRGQTGSARPGRALMHLGDGALRTVQVPTTDPTAVVAALGAPATTS